jgi:hypothetical protein
MENNLQMAPLLSGNVFGEGARMECSIGYTVDR